MVRRCAVGACLRARGAQLRMGWDPTQFSQSSMTWSTINISPYSLHLHRLHAGFLKAEAELSGA